MNNNKDDPTAAADVLVKGRDNENGDDANNDDCKNSKCDDKTNSNAEASVSGKKRSIGSLESNNKEDEASVSGKKRSIGSLESNNKEDEDNTKATKEHVLEFKWQIYEENEDDEKKFSMFEDEITDNSLGTSRVVCENEEGENHEYNLTIGLVNGKSEDRRVLAKISVDFWKEGINLMHFNQKSQDLANFCRHLWSASGRNKRLYPDMEIELGESRYSDVEIKELVEEATDEEYADDIIYIHTATLTQGSTKNESLELMNRLFDKVAVFVIAHRTDLKKMGFDSITDENGGIRFSFVGDGWFVIDSLIDR